MNPGIALMMIVKNEVQTLPTLIAGVKPLISRWVIVDTGSSDGTQALVQELLGDLPGNLVEMPWVNFGHNRTELVKLFPEDCQFALLLDADQIFHVESPQAFFAELAESAPSECLLITVKDESLDYSMPYLVRRGPQYFYVGATHEFLTAKEPLRKELFRSAFITHVGNGGSKADKFTRDRALLTSDIASGNDSSRNHFYLGQTLEALNEADLALTEYRIAFEKSKWDEERYVAALRSGRILNKQNHPEQALTQFVTAHEQCPDRLEAVFEMVKIHESRQNWALAWRLLQSVDFKRAPRILFNEPWIARYGLQLESGVVAWNLGWIDLARETFNNLLRLDDLPEATVDLIKKNLTYC